MKSLQRSLIMFLALFLYACGGGSSSGGGSATAEEALVVEASVPSIVMYNDTVVLDASASYSADCNISSYTWTQKDGDVSVDLLQGAGNSAVVSFVADVPAPCTLSFILTVVDQMGRQGQAVYSVHVRLGETLEKENLFAAYAGIGYRNLSEESDNEYLYEMFTNNLIRLGMVLPLRIMENCLNVLEFANFFSATNDTEDPYVLYKYPDNPIISTADSGYGGTLSLYRDTNKDLVKNGKTWIWFKAVSDISMDGTGMVNGLASYTYGRVISAMTGYLYAESLVGKFYFHIKNFDVTTANDDSGRRLVAEYDEVGYGKTYLVTYKDWNVNFEINYGADDFEDSDSASGEELNTYLLPTDSYLYLVDPFSCFFDVGRDESYTDNRDYTVSGSVVIQEENQAVYNTYCVDARYRQNPVVYRIAGSTTPGYATKINGTFSVPDLPYPVTIDTGDSAVYSNKDGIWEGGALLINDGQATIGFNNTSGNNVAIINEFGITSSQSNWQNELAYPIYRD